MLKTILLLLSLIFSSLSFAACFSDLPEIGDTGPDSQLVCTVMGARLPHTNIVVVDRKIHSPNSVSVIITVDGKSESLDYKLMGADWKLSETALEGV